MRALVVGAGAYGLACAERLARGGADVCVYEQLAPADPRAASGGFTRVLRFEYGAEARYTELTVRAVGRWRELEQEARTTLFEPVGVVHLAHGDGAFERASYEVVSAAGPRVELLTPAEVRARWPVFAVDDLAFALHSPDGGFLWARRATEALAAAARAAGARVCPGARVRELARDGVVLADGTSVSSDLVVVCAGSWSGSLDERLCAVAPTRQVTASFRGELGAAPVFGDGGLDFYGIPAPGGTAVKIGWHRVRHAPVGDPSSEAERRVRDEDLAPLRTFLRQRLPSLASAPVEAADVCFYAMTRDEHPVVDWLDERTLACCGLSGHGFKFSPVLGAAVAELALGLEPSVDLRGFELRRRALA